MYYDAFKKKHPSPNFHVALTGGIGSGKSLAASFFKSQGVPVLEADDVAHHLTQPGQLAYETICHYFGLTVITPSGHLNRNKLREIIFSDKKAKIWLENLLHPKIRHTMQAFIKKSHYPYGVSVIPLLIETKGYTESFNRILCIQAPKSICLKRASIRDKTTLQAINAISNQQTNEITRRQFSDDCITNTGSTQALKNKVFDYHRYYKKLAKNTND